MDDKFITELAVRVAALLRHDPVATFVHRAASASSQTTGGSHAIRRMIAARQLRNRYFGEDLFADPAWDMLLDLYAAYLESGEVSVSSLCIASAVPPTTALRWLVRLEKDGMVERHNDPFDKRRSLISLTPNALSRMAAYLRAIE